MNAPGPATWRILVVDDDPAYAEGLARALVRRGHGAFTALDADAALIQAREQPLDAVILDLRLADTSGLHLIPPLLAQQPGLRILLLTGYASIATAVQAMKLGAVHYLPKPAEVRDILGALGLADGDPQDLPPETPMSVDRLEWEHIQQVLAEHDGNISATARALKMHRRTLQRKLSKRPVRG